MDAFFDTSDSDTAAASIPHAERKCALATIAATTAGGLLYGPVGLLASMCIPAVGWAWALQKRRQRVRRMDHPPALPARSTARGAGATLQEMFGRLRTDNLAPTAPSQQNIVSQPEPRLAQQAAWYLGAAVVAPLTCAVGVGSWLSREVSSIQKTLPVLVVRRRELGSISLSSFERELLDKSKALRILEGSVFPNLDKEEKGYYASKVVDRLKEAGGGVLLLDFRRDNVRLSGNAVKALGGMKRIAIETRRVDGDEVTDTIGGIADCVQALLRLLAVLSALRTCQNKCSKLGLSASSKADDLKRVLLTIIEKQKEYIELRDELAGWLDIPFVRLALMTSFEFHKASVSDLKPDLAHLTELKQAVDRAETSTEGLMQSLILDFLGSSGR